MTTKRDRRPTLVLLVEDDPDQAALVRIMLESALGQNHELVHVDRVAEAQDELAQGDMTCVLLDLSLPDARELQGLLQLHAAAPEVPIIVLSARTEELLAIRAVEEGAQDYLVKGKVDADLLGRAVRYAIARKRTESQARLEATHDPMTGLANRTLLRDRLEHVLARSRRQFTSFALLFLDLDGFKQINDLEGHAVGDEVLVQVASRIREVVRAIDTPARYGGDEFVVLCEQVKSEDEAAEIADRIATQIGQPFVVDGKELRVGVSIGVALVPARSRPDVDTLIREADEAMYGAKSTGASFRIGSL
jgi:diguanylate cyclase (GGDEF)-like protein